MLSHTLMQNVVALYGVQLCTYALPLITFPYLARVLGPSGWGSVVFAQAIGAVIAIFVEYGFDISAARETSLHRDDSGRLAGLISGVLGAKVLLSGLCVLGSLFCRRFTYHIAPSPALFWASTLWGVCQGINMLWYFQGLERMRLASALEIAGKVAATLSIFVMVRKPADGWKVMAAQCVGCIVAHGITVAIAYREVGFSHPTVSSVWRALRLGWSMFLFRAAQGLTTSLNSLVLGSVAPTAALGVYAGAERIARVFQQGMWPINQALYPRLTHQLQVERSRAVRTMGWSVLFLGSLGLVLGSALFFAAPFLIHLSLGPAFDDSVPVLRVFALWIPLVALSTVLTFLVFLPHKLDYQFNFVTLTAGALSIGSALLLAPRFHATGIAWSAVAAQLYTLLAFCIILYRAGLHPFSRTQASEPVIGAPYALPLIKQMDAEQGHCLSGPEVLQM